MGDYQLAQAVIEFTAATEAEWNKFPTPLPHNVVVFTTDTRIFKRGNGVHRFSELANGPKIDDIAEAGDIALAILTLMTEDDEDKFIIVDGEVYKPSQNRAQMVADRLANVQTKDLIQTISLNTVENQFSMMDTAVVSGTEGDLAVKQNGKVRSHPTLKEQVVEVTDYTPIHLRKLLICSDRLFKNPVRGFQSHGTYYVQIVGSHDKEDRDDLGFTLNSDHDGVTITPLGRNEFQVVIAGSGELTLNHPAPNQYTIEPVLEADPGSTVSRSVTPTGYVGATTWSVSGGDVLARTTSDANYRTSGLIAAGEALILRRTSNLEFDKTDFSTVLIGGVVTQWLVSTRTKMILLSWSLGVYSDAGLTDGVSVIEGTITPGDEKTYYVKLNVVLGDVDQSELTYQIDSSLGDAIQFTHLGDGLFTMVVGDTGDIDGNVTINAAVNYVVDSVTVDTLTKSLTLATLAVE